MRKMLFTSVLFCSVALLTACQPSAPENTSTASPTPITSASPSTTVQADEIIKGITAGQSYRCTFTEKDSTNQMEYAIRGKQVSARVTTASEEVGTQVIRMIVDETTIHWWDESTKQGMKMPARSADNTPSNQPQVPNFNNMEAWSTLQQQYSVSCKPDMLSDADFTLPADVTFTDLSKMMQGMVPPSN